MRKAKRFKFPCGACHGTGLKPQDGAVYGVAVCDACDGKGRGQWTIMQRIDQLGGLLYSQKEGSA
jgi:DnaJ-class molecular chaperone